MTSARRLGLFLFALFLQVSASRCQAQAVKFDDPGVRYLPETQTTANGGGQADQDAQAANDIGNLLDQIPNDIVHGGERGLLAGAAALVAMEFATGGAITIPLAITVLSSGAFLGVEAASSHAIDVLTTALGSIAGDD